MSFFFRTIPPARAAALACPFLHLWAKTLHFRQQGYGQVGALRSRAPMVFALWHDELFTPCYVHRNESIIALVSASQDGEYLAQMMARLGFNLARGSSSKGGTHALREALHKLTTLHKDVVFTVDGPKGPRHQVKEGAVYLAHKAGLYLTPLRTYNSRKKIFHKAWDRFQLPLPGSISTIYYGQPYKIQASKLTAKILYRETRILEEKLEQLLPENP